MKGITFGALHSYNDMNLILSSKEIGSPEVKERKIEIEGSDSAIDLTEFFGEPKYEDVTHKFHFSAIGTQAQLLSLFSTVKNALHGKKMRIILDDDPLFFYMGRIKVLPFTNEKNIGKITIEADCEPYKYRISTKQLKLCGKNLLNLDSAIIPRPLYWTKTETGYSFDRGTATGNGYAYFRIPVVKGKTYTFSAVGTTYTGGSPSMIVYKDFESREIIKRVNSLYIATFIALHTGTYDFALIANSTTITANFTNVMVEEGNAATAFEDYDSTEKTVEETFSNLRKTAIPTVYATGSITVSKGTTVSTLTNGVNVLPEFAFLKGDTALTFAGNGVAVVEWKEGIL